MLENQLSQFDTRCISFNRKDGLYIRYDMFSPDLIISRNGKFAIKDKEVVKHYRRDGEWAFDVSYKDIKKTYTLKFLLDFVKYDNCDMCFCECIDAHRRQ